MAVASAHACASRLKELDCFGVDGAEGVMDEVGDVMEGWACATAAQAGRVLGVNVVDEVANSGERAGLGVAMLRRAGGGERRGNFDLEVKMAVTRVVLDHAVRDAISAKAVLGGVVMCTKARIAVGVSEGGEPRREDGVMADCEVDISIDRLVAERVAREARKAGKR